MPVNKKDSESAWFYHAPARKAMMDKVEAPAPSQIPGIGFDDPNESQREEVREMMFKDTDSDYIRLAKMGGRKDLLSFDPDKYKYKQKKQNQGYHRSDWYYLEDNRLEEQEKKEEEKKEWEFLLPDYMVHQGYQPSFSNPATPPTRGNNGYAPYHTEKNTIIDHDDTDKFTSKIPEPRKEGYGIRNQRAPAKVQPLPPREKPANSSALRNKAKPQFSLPSENEAPTNMMKLLAGEYERDWHKAHEDFVKTSKSNPRPNDNETGSATHSATKARHDAEAAISAAAMRRKAREQEERDLFKLQRFKNVPSKVDSHQRPEILASAK